MSESARLAAARQKFMEQYSLCTYGPPLDRKPHWILKFEDADRGEMHFDNEDEAHSAFDKYEGNWTCTLYVTARKVL